MRLVGGIVFTSNSPCRPGFGVSLNKTGLERPYSRSKEQVNRYIVVCEFVTNIGGLVCKSLTLEEQYKV